MPHNRKSIVRRKPKLKLLLDESIAPRNYFKQLNAIFNVKHIKQDLKKGGLSDPEVYKIAKEQNRILITYNVKDFRPLIESDQPSVIGLSPQLSAIQIDLKLTSFLKILKQKDLLGKFFPVPGKSI